MAGRFSPEAVPGANILRWEETIRQFEAQDAAGTGARGAILFVGSSSITRWDLGQYFPGWDVVNRGFGGSLLAEVAVLAGRYVTPPAPRQVILYAGDNDLACGATPAQVLESYRYFVETVQAALPSVQIVFLSIKPSPARRHLMPEMREANRLVREDARQGKQPGFLDLFTAMLNDEGEPRPELFIEDGLHPSHRCYLLWAEMIRPLLMPR